MMKAKYDWKNAETKMLRMLRNSKAIKEKNGWSNNVGAGFVKEDLTNAILLANNTILIEFPGWNQKVKTGDLNLRETNELIKYLEEKSK